VNRSGYSDDYDGGHYELYRASVERSLKGKRGQAFLREMVAALEAMPEKELSAGRLVDEHGDCCALGAVALRRYPRETVEMLDLDAYDSGRMSDVFGISESMAREIAWLNDEGVTYDALKEGETPDQHRHRTVLAWAKRHLGEPSEK